MENKYHYKLISTGSNSKKYGVCEVCGGYASEVFHQIETKDFFSIETNRIEQQHIGNTFGHEQCLINRQKNLDNLDGQE